ncbi:hypothetical protein [Actinomadura sp. 9N407]|uniref:hypothetical protein n=1 Tax=Actinomadura sp. 9N407 TaxID=3375154 RepID=UPI00379EDDBF
MATVCVAMLLTGCSDKSASDDSLAPARATPSGSSAAAPALCNAPEFERLLKPPSGVGLRISLCRGRYAYVSVQGPKVGVHNSQDYFLEKRNGKWRVLAAGETSHGRFTAQSLTAAGLDARMLANLFPEAKIHVPPPAATPDPAIPTKTLPAPAPCLTRAEFAATRYPPPGTTLQVKSIVCDKGWAVAHAAMPPRSTNDVALFRWTGSRWEEVYNNEGSDDSLGELCRKITPRLQVKLGC